MVGSSFLTTRWSLVLASAQDGTAAERALEDLCSLYWPPVFAFYRKCGHDEESARDLTQGLFSDLLAREDFARATPERGRFRSYLRQCARNFAANSRRSENAEKRGGAAKTISLDIESASGARAITLVDDDDPQQCFERNYARQVIALVLERLETEFEDKGRGDSFRALRSYLETGEGPGYAESARQIGKSEGAVRVLVHRMRKRFGELLTMEIQGTLADPDDTGDEIRHLLAALRSPSHRREISDSQ